MASRSCQRASPPAGLKSAAQLIDVEKMRAGISTLPATRVLLSVQHEATEDKPLVAVLDRGSLDLRDAELLRVAVRSAVLAQPKEEPWAVRLRATTGDTTALALAPSEYCPPVPIAPAGAVVASAGMSAAAHEVQTPAASGPLGVRVLVSRVGNVMDAVLIKPSGSLGQDQMVLEAVRRRRFHPARMDGVPVTSWYEIGSRGGGGEGEGRRGVSRGRAGSSCLVVWCRNMAAIG